MIKKIIEKIKEFKLIINKLNNPINQTINVLAKPVEQTRTNDIEIEIWKDVNHPIFKKFYEVSNLGRLKTKGRNSTRGRELNRYTYWVSPRIVSVRRSKENPHLFCSLYAHSVLLKNKTAYVHKMVAEAFIKRPTKEHVYVSHIDGNYDNNMVRNLKWITASENSKSNIEKYPENRLKLKQVNEENGYYEKIKHPIREKSNVFKVKSMIKLGVSQKEIARIYGCSVSTVYNLIKNK